MAPSPRDERLVDLLVAGVSLSLMALLLAMNLGRQGAPSDRPDPATVHAIELRAVALDASLGLPASVKTAIGLDEEPLATRPGLLDELSRNLDLYSGHLGLRLVWISLAVGWHEDSAARKAIVALSTHPERKDLFQSELDDLTRLSNGLPAENLDTLRDRLTALGASRWLLGLVSARHLDNARDPTASSTSAELQAIATDVAHRQAIFFLIQVLLLLVGLIFAIAMPLFLRGGLARKGHVSDLAPTPFRPERTTRVLLAWFVGYQLAGLLIFLTLGQGPRASAYAMPLGGLASGVIALALIELWGRTPDTLRPLRLDFGLTRPTRPGPLGVLLWTIPAIGFCALLTWLFELLNRDLLGIAPETQSSLKLLLSTGDPLTLGLIGLGAVIIAPLVEELLFRAYLFRNLRDRLGSGLAVVISGFIFAAVHAHPSLLLPLTGLGIALALLYEWTGSIWVPIIAHAAWNLMTLITVEATWRI
jgi:membrane protease YdiL (CAAX protease family)